MQSSHRSGSVTNSLRTRSVLLAASGISLFLVSQPAFAQEAAPKPAAAAEGNLAEIVVTAQKRSESAQKVPIAITAIGAAAIEDRQINDIADLVKLVPAMTVGQNYGANVVAIRGVSTGLTSGAEDPSVAVHVNGVYQPRSRGIDLATMDLSRVEVLSGPQGTLYGRNATGGVINYITNGPSDHLEEGVTASAGNYSTFGLKGYISGPLSDKIGVRVFGLYNDQGDGYIKNLLPGAPHSTFGGGNTLAAHAAITIKASDSLKFEIDGIYGRTNSSTIFEAFGPTLFGPGVAAFLGQQSFAPHEVYSPYPGPFDNKDFQVSLTSTLALAENVQLKSITAYQGYQDQMAIDNSASQNLAVAVNQTDHSRSFTQELDLSTHTFSNRLTSIFGFFYFHDQLDILAGVPFVIAPAPNYYVYGTQQTSESYAFFTDQTFSVTDRLRLVAGVRINHDSKSVANQLNVQVTPTGPSVYDVCGTQEDKGWNSTTPKVGVQYDATRNVMVYGGWQKGFKAGGFAANTCGNGYDPETIEGPEFGFKSELLDHHLRLNMAGYWYKYNNLQVQRVAGIGQFSVQNAAAATLKGIELSALAKLTPEFSIDLTSNVESAKYDSFFNCDNTNPANACNTNPIPANLQDLSGHWLNHAPPYTVNLGAQYRFNLFGGNLLLRAESYWSGFIHFDPYATLPQMTQPAFNLQNLYVTYTPANSHIQVRAWVKNVGDTNYKSAGFYNSADGEPTGNWAPPRTFGGEISLKF